MSKTLVFSILENQQKPNFETVFEKWKNSKLSKEIKDNKIVYSLKNYLFVKETISVLPIKIVIDDNFAKNLKIIEKKALNQAKGINFKEETDWSLKPDYKDRIGHCINKIMRYNYLDHNSDEYNFFYLTVDMFMGLLKYHPANNGNKRFAICFLKVFLETNGYYLKWTSFFWNKDNGESMKNFYKEQIEEKMVEFTEKLQNKEGTLSKDDENKVREEIYNWLTNNILISFNFKYN